MFNHDPNEAMAGALATAGVVGGAALLMRAGRGVAQVGNYLKDRRYRITHLTDDFSGEYQAGRLANYRFEQYGKALIKNPEQRKALTFALEGNRPFP